MAIYSITDVNNLEESSSNLSSYAQTLQNDTESLAYILKMVKENWQNEAGADLASYIYELQSCINSLSNTIVPTLNKFSKTMNILAQETRINQNNTMN